MGHGSSNPSRRSQNSQTLSTQQFQDLKELPPEVAISVLSNLNATDLCLASCVWKDLAEDELLWKGLCTTKWSYVTVYNQIKNKEAETKFRRKPVYKSLYLLLDEATLIFAFKPHQGIKYLIENNVIEDSCDEIAKFIDNTTALFNKSVQIFLKDRGDVLEQIINYQNFTGLSLCDSLRSFYKKIHPPEQRGAFLDLLVDKFAKKFYECNPDCGFNKEHISVLCYSLLLLSVDLYSPHVKNKMSKREFIRNNRQVLADANRDILSDIYDDVYLNGHIVPNCKQIPRKKHRFPFYRPYGAIFEFKPTELKLNCSC